MASITKPESETPKASGAIAPPAQTSSARSDAPPGRRRKAGGGFFSIYKHGQGYWTRMGTAIGSGVLGLMLSYTIYDKITAVGYADLIGFEWSVGFLVVFCITAWLLMNRPTNADFLIATDSEMKKVNWTSRRELIGSTQVVILFMFFIAIFLFSVDQIWGWIMYALKVLVIPPPPFG